MKPNPVTNWQRLDTIVTAAATLIALALLIGSAAGWNFSLTI